MCGTFTSCELNEYTTNNGCGTRIYSGTEITIGGAPDYGLTIPTKTAPLPTGFATNPLRVCYRCKTTTDTDGTLRVLTFYWYDCTGTPSLIPSGTYPNTPNIREYNYNPSSTTSIFPSIWSSVYNFTLGCPPIN